MKDCCKHKINDKICIRKSDFKKLSVYQGSLVVRNVETLKVSLCVVVVLLIKIVNKWEANEVAKQQ